MAEPNPRIVVPPEVTAAGPTPSPTNRTVVAAEGGLPLPLPLIALMALLLIGGFVFVLFRDGSSEVTAEGQELGVLTDPTTSPDPPSTVAAVGSAESTTTVPQTTESAPATTAAAVATVTTGAAPTTTVAPTTTAAPEIAPAELAGPPVRETGTIRHAVFSGGTLYLRGAVPSADFGDQIVAAAEAVVGEGNVINQYRIDPLAPAADSAPLYVADTVLFVSSQAGINPQFFPILDIGTRLLTVNENVRIEVIAHTDDIGSDALNARLSQIRADSVLQYWLDQGADPARITAVGRGEAEPIADNSTAAGRQANRRAEFIVIGILG